MTDPRETHFTGAEGECKNSQAKRSDPDDTSERTAKLPDTKGATVPAHRAHRNLSGNEDKLNTEKI